MALQSRRAGEPDIALLGELNHQLIQDEGHRNSMTVVELQERMRGFLNGDYKATLFENDGQVVAYALYWEEPELIYLRQLFVQRDSRRRGYGRQALKILRDEIWPAQKRITVDVLIANPAAISFYRALGFSDYCLTLEIQKTSP